MATSFKFSLSKFTKKIKKMPPEMKHAATLFLYQEGERIMTAAKKLTPVQYGILRSSGHVSLPEKKGGTTVVKLAFGGAAAPYAIFVHEINTPHKVGQWKYLETPFDEAAKTFNQRLAAHLKKTFKNLSL